MINFFHFFTSGYKWSLMFTFRQDPFFKAMSNNKSHVTIYKVHEIYLNYKI